MRKTLPSDRLPLAPLSERGLSSTEAGAQRAVHGCNDIIETPRRLWPGLLRDTATDPMLWFLVGTGGVYAALGNHAEAATLFIAILPLLGLDAFLHWRTQASTLGLRSRLAVTATVVRDGATRDMPAREIVPGDLALVGPGETFPADGVILAGQDLQADESSLTGEAYPVDKKPLSGLPAGANAPLVEDESWGMAGTRLLTGQARMRVVFTGAETLYGQIVLLATRGSRSLTPLQRAVAGLVSTLVAAATALCLILGVIRLRQGHGWLDALMSAVTLAVAALPEEFPVALSFFLGVGVYRLARRRALVRRAVCVENIGRITCICSDKTGTITEGLLRVSQTHPAPGHDDKRLLQLAALASRRETADPLDIAVLERAGEGASLGSETLATFPFTEDRRRQTLLVRGQDGELLATTKGSPEVVLGLCGLGDDELGSWTGRVASLAEGGRKVIACAWRRLEEGGRRGEEPERGFHFAGLLVCEDAIRKGVPEAVRQCQEAGIHTLMVTGDHPGTARSVARAIGLGHGEPRVISGEELDLEIEAGKLDLREVDVIARAQPSQKLSLVRALQGRGEIVAVTGDGVNDVPALQAADIGIAMGERGTRAAREAASIVLLDDNFRSIVRAIAEGRQLFRNLRLSFAYLLMIHVGLVATATLIPLAGYPLLYLPVHIVWLEMLIHPTALLVFQEPARERLEPKPARARMGFFSRREWVVIGLVGTLLTFAVSLAYDRGLGPRGRVEHARALALLVLTLTSAGLAAVLSGLRTRTSRTVAAATVALSLVLLQAPPSAAILHVEALHLDDWAAALAAVLLVLSPLAFAGFNGPRRGFPALAGEAAGPHPGE